MHIFWAKILNVKQIINYMNLACLCKILKLKFLR